MQPELEINAYLVGGAVRDMLLGLDVSDRDWVVVGSTPAEMRRLGFRQVGRDFPVFLHPQSGEEYALARTERKTAPGYRGFTFSTDPDVTLEQDLLRRDLTINAMAMDGEGQLFDPYEGQQDLKARRLRHVSPAFAEDPVRILRIAKFAARFDHLEFEVDSNTNQLMTQMVTSGEIDTLVPERVWQELHSAMHYPGFVRFIEVLRQCGGLKKILPEVDCLFGIPQTAKYHPEIDTGLHVMLALQAAIEEAVSAREIFAVLLHDVGKGVTEKDKLPSHHGHETRGLAIVKQVCDRLRVPGDFRKLALVVCEYHLHLHRLAELKPSTILKLIEANDGFRDRQRITEFVRCCRADLRGRTGKEQDPYIQGDKLLRCYRVAAAVNARDIATNADQQGEVSGEKIKMAIRQARITAIQQLIQSA